MSVCQRCGRKMDQSCNLRMGCGLDENIFRDMGMKGKTFPDVHLHHITICFHCKDEFVKCVMMWYESAPEIQGQHKNCLCDTCQIHTPI